MQERTPLSYRVAGRTRRRRPESKMKTPHAKEKPSYIDAILHFRRGREEENESSARVGVIRFAGERLFFLLSFLRRCLFLLTIELWTSRVL